MDLPLGSEIVAAPHPLASDQIALYRLLHPSDLEGLAFIDGGRYRWRALLGVPSGLKGLGDIRVALPTYARLPAIAMLSERCHLCSRLGQKSAQALT